MIGIDPGLKGGIACICNGRVEWACDIPIMGEGAKARVNAMELLELFRLDRIDHAFIERAQAFPGQGASSGFSYGRATGALEAVVLCSEIPLSHVEASMWKKHFGLKKADKENSRLEAIKLFGPKFLERKMDHGRAEAILIALYGMERVEQALRK